MWASQLLWITMPVFWELALTDSGALQVYKSNACYLKGECGLHFLGCPANHRIALHSAAHGFKPYSDICFHEGPGIDCLSLNTSFCCSEERDRDCVLSYRERHLHRIFEKCSGRPTCKFAPIAVTDSCYSMSKSEPASFSTLAYGCVKESVIGNFCQRDVITGSSVSAVFKPNGLNMLYDRNCYCRVESASLDVIDVQVYAIDVRFKRSTNNRCSQLSITKGRETHGTVSTPTLPGEGFIHSFMPLVNLSTPILTRLMLNKFALPDYIWLHFESSQGNLRLKCGLDDDRSPPPCMKGLVPDVPSPDDFNPKPVKRYPRIVGVMVEMMRMLFFEKTPIIGAGIAAVLTVLSCLVLGAVMYKRRHLKKIKSVKVLPKVHSSPKQQIRSCLSRVGSQKNALRRVPTDSKDAKDDSSSDTSSKSSTVSSPATHNPVHLNNVVQQVSHLRNVQRNAQNDANIIIVSRPSRNESMRSNCTCSSRGQPNLVTGGPPDVVLDSRAALQSVCEELNALHRNSCCNHNGRIHRNNVWCQGDTCNHGNSSCSHRYMHSNACCGHDSQLRHGRLNSVASQASVGTQIYGDPLPEVADPLPEIAEVPVLPTRKKRNIPIISQCLDANKPLYVVHNTKKIKDISKTNRIWNWLKKSRNEIRKLPEIPEDDNSKKFAKKQEVSTNDVINTTVTSPSVLPLPAPPTPPSHALMPGIPPPSSIPSTAPPKPPPRLPPRPRPPRRSIRAALRTVSDVYTQVVNIPPKRQKVKPRVPRRRCQDTGTQVYLETKSNDVNTATNDVTRETPVTTTRTTTSPAVIDVTIPEESEASNYANDYIMPVHTSRGYTARNAVVSGSYDEVSLGTIDNDIDFLHTVTLGITPEEETVSKFDRLKSVLLQSFMRWRGK